MASLPVNILDQMLAAGAAAAGAQWPQVSADLKSYTQGLIADSATVLADLASGAITEAAGKVAFDAIGDEAAMLANYLDEQVKLAAQNAINAAEDVLWSAITVAAKAG